ncbi:MAG: serine/threonine protein kinase [Deltaproteobacteria bacterium]|nr:serine/threonine protein kinase [Deltaproteobacteria bacterium]
MRMVSEEGGMGGCLDENQLAELVEGRLASGGQRALMAHLDGCRSCRQVLAAFARSAAPTEQEGSQDSAIAATLMAQKRTALPEIGRTLSGRFQLGRILGYGAMGVVYEAQDGLLGLKVALKVLRPDIAEKAELLKHLRREILLGRRISHPNACRIYDLGADDELHFITQELVAGESLQAILERAPVAPAWIVPILKQVCAGLAAAHQEGIVHRDLKPANIMLEDTGRAVVMDFGLAADETRRELSQGGPVGTPAFWAPEQARGEPATPASDVWAVGAIAYLLFTGRRYAPAASLDGVPPEARTFVRRCLEPNPEMRPRTAKEAYRVLSGTSPSLAPLHAPRRVWLWALLALVAIAAFLVVFLLGRGGLSAPVGSSSSSGERLPTPDRRGPGLGARPESASAHGERC